MPKSGACYDHAIEFHRTIYLSHFSFQRLLLLLLLLLFPNRKYNLFRTRYIALRTNIIYNIDIDGGMSYYVCTNFSSSCEPS